MEIEFNPYIQGIIRFKPVELLMIDFMDIDRYGQNHAEKVCRCKKQYTSKDIGYWVNEVCKICANGQL